MTVKTWEERIAEAVKNYGFSQEDKELAGTLNYCIIGEKYGDRYYDNPVLDNASMAFYYFVSHNQVTNVVILDKAIKTWDAGRHKKALRKASTIKSKYSYFASTMRAMEDKIDDEA